MKGDLPTRERMKMKLYPGDSSFPEDKKDVMAISNAYADGVLQTRQEFIGNLDHEVFAAWIYTFAAPVGVIHWKRLTQQRREAFVKAISDGIAAALVGSRESE